MNRSLNLCTSVLPSFDTRQAAGIAAAAGFQGIELRVNDDWHQSLDNLEQSGSMLRDHFEAEGLAIQVLNSYAGIDQERSVARLLTCAELMEVPMVRLVLPRAMTAAVARLSSQDEILPSYNCPLPPRELVRSVQYRLHELEARAASHGVRLLLELHWGTIMSSFSAAALLLDGVDPSAIGITFDPANMIVEGREDWQFGIHLVRDYIANVHVKNSAWTRRAGTARWHWEPISAGMVNWRSLISHLGEIDYAGPYAIEDFLTPRASEITAIEYLREKRLQFLSFVGESEPSCEPVDIPVAV